MTTRRVEPAAVGAAVAGALGAWCATGALTIDGAATRLGALPPLWLLAIFGITSLLAVVGTRATARDAAPLWCPLISVLPWLPVPLPAAAALWVGPLGQILAATALVAVLARRVVPSGWITTARPIPAVIVLASLFLAAAWWLSPRIPGGDEPHYLVIAQSLLEDGDLRIEDNHQRRDYAAYVEGDLRPDYLRRGRGRRHLLGSRPRAAGPRRTGVPGRRIPRSGRDAGAAQRGRPAHSVAGRTRDHRRSDRRDSGRRWASGSRPRSSSRRSRSIPMAPPPSA